MLTKFIYKVRKPYYIIKQFGLDFRSLILAMYNLPYYIKSYITFKSNYKGAISLYPCLLDRHIEAGNIKNEYFWQDLFVAKWIYMANPENHLDIGSRIDGFVAHLAVFRNVDLVDIRPVSQNIPNVRFIQCDFTNTDEVIKKIGVERYESVSSLHTIEHIGLGRYGDRIDPFLYKSFLRNLSLVLKPEGLLYLSCPVGKERVEFNAHRIFHPLKLKEELQKFGLKVNRYYILDNSKFELNLVKTETELADISNVDYRLAIIVCKKEEKNNEAVFRENIG